MPIEGTKANTNSTMPKPPNHCVMLRHRRMEAGSHSTAEKTVEPVEVMPEVDSNKASEKLCSTPVVRNGSVPNNTSTTHMATTSTYEVRLSVILFALRKLTNSISPILKVNRPDTRMSAQVPSLKCSAGIRQLRIKRPSTISVMPRNRSMYFKFCVVFVSCE